MRHSAVLVLVALCPIGLQAAPRLPRPYLALFTFQSSRLDQLTDEQLRVLDASPYDGMAVWLADTQATQPPPELDALRPRLDHLRGHTRKHLWPFAFLNRMLGQNPEGKRHQDLRADPVFARIRGMDLDDEAGARTAFLLNWRRSLQVARALGTPGIGLDPEFYNNYDLEGVTPLARCRGERDGVTLEKLHALGRSMADIVSEEYPDAVIWSLFTRLCGRRSHAIDGVPGHILQALLDRANEKRIPLVLVEGAEDGIGYTSPSFAELEQKITGQAQRYGGLRERYPQILLGGTIAPWVDKEHRAYWMKDEPMVDTIEDFRPAFALMMQRLDFVWIYGAGNAYHAWDKRYYERFHPVLAAAKAQARGE